jgi:hypothetical protein
MTGQKLVGEDGNAGGPKHQSTSQARCSTEFEFGCISELNNRETGGEPSDCLGCEIWVRLGCNKNSRGLLEAPKVAIGAVKLQLVTSERWTVTAEVASSSLVVPAIFSNHLQALTLTDQGILGDDKRQKRIPNWEFSA